MKILQICNKVPYPPRDGGAVATLAMSKGFTELGHEVTILAMNTPKHFISADAIPPELKNKMVWELVDVNNDIRWLPALLNLLFTNLPYHVFRFRSKDFKEKLKTLLKENDFDVIQLEGLYLAQYVPVIKDYSDAIISLRAHNVEHEIWNGLADNTRNFLMRTYIGIQANRIYKYERSVLQHVDRIIAISKNDAIIFQEWHEHIPVHVTPVGVDGSIFSRTDYKGSEISFFHIGALDWIPNQQALDWFLQEIWTQVSSKHPQLKFHIAGRNPSAWQQNKNLAHVMLDGEVEDAYEYMSKHSIMVVPLKSGSGMRVKIMEAMALGKTVITTSNGLQGIGAENNKEVLIADSAEQFIEQIERCIHEPELVTQIGQLARSYIKENFDNITLVKKLIQFYN